jgi:hypothetical protein
MSGQKGGDNSSRLTLPQPDTLEVSARKTTDHIKRFDTVHQWQGGATMFTDWNEEFDVVCGARIRTREDEPLEDSGIWDLMHGTRVESIAEELAQKSLPQTIPPGRYPR